VPGLPQEIAPMQ